MSLTLAANAERRQWHANRSQPASIFDITLPEGPLTVVLATIEEVESRELYIRLEQEYDKEVWHIAGATRKGTVTYPVNAEIHEFPVYHKGRKRQKGLLTFWTACKETAAAGGAVVIHCNSTFHRGPLALIGIMIFAGYDKDEAISEIVAHRHIYPGHYVPYEEWPPSETKSKHAEDFLECHRWLQTLTVPSWWAAADDAVTAVADAVVPADIADAADATDANAADANVANAADAAVAANAAPAGANDANMRDGGDWWRWRCSSCDRVDQNLRQCWECGRWDCKSCSFWCTRCPRKYLICGHCNAQDMYLVRRGKTWRCARCERERT